MQEYDKTITHFGEANITKALKENFGESFVAAMNLLYKLDEEDKQQVIASMGEMLKADKYFRKPARE